MMLAVSFPRSLKKRKKKLLLGGGGYKSNIRLAFGIMTSNTSGSSYIGYLSNKVVVWATTLFHFMVLLPSMLCLGGT